jgi:hypothetical protein
MFPMSLLLAPLRVPLLGLFLYVCIYVCMYVCKFLPAACILLACTSNHSAFCQTHTVHSYDGIGAGPMALMLGHEWQHIYTVYI